MAVSIDFCKRKQQEIGRANFLLFFSEDAFKSNVKLNALHRFQWESSCYPDRPPRKAASSSRLPRRADAVELRPARAHRRDGQKEMRLRQTSCAVEIACLSR